MNKADIIINLTSTAGMNTGDIVNILTMLDSNEKVVCEHFVFKDDINKLHAFIFLTREAYHDIRIYGDMTLNEYVKSTIMKNGHINLTRKVFEDRHAINGFDIKFLQDKSFKFLTACKCGRLHFCSKDMIMKIQDEEKFLLLICEHCSRSYIFGIDNLGKLWEETINSIDPDDNIEIYVDRGVGVPLTDGEIAHSYENLCFCNDNSRTVDSYELKKDLPEEYIRAIEKYSKENDSELYTVLFDNKEKDKND